MALLEALLLAAGQAATPAPPPLLAPPPLELLEFLADWSDEDGRLIDKEKTPVNPRDGKKPPAPPERDAKGKAP